MAVWLPFQEFVPSFLVKMVRMNLHKTDTYAQTTLMSVATVSQVHGEHTPKLSAGLLY